MREIKRREKQREEIDREMRETKRREK